MFRKVTKFGTASNINVLFHSTPRPSVRLHREFSHKVKKENQYKIQTTNSRYYSEGAEKTKNGYTNHDSDDEVKIPPPPHPPTKQPPFEWTYPIIVGALGGLITTGIYYLYHKSNEENNSKEITSNNQNSRQNQRETNQTSKRNLNPNQNLHKINTKEETNQLEEEKEENDEEDENFQYDHPPISPMQVVNSFPYLPEDARELESTFKYAGTFGIALGPKEFNRYHLINDYLSETRHAIVFNIRPSSYASTLFRNTTNTPQNPSISRGNQSGIVLSNQNQHGKIRELLRNSLTSTIDFGLVPMIEHVGGDVLEQLTQLIQQRGPSSDQFIWIDNFDVILDYIDSIEDIEIKQREEYDLRCLLNWLIEMSLYKEWSQVLIQSNDPFLLSRLDKYLSVRSSPDVRIISFGERSPDDMEQRLNQLLILNEICMTQEDISFFLKTLGGSAPVLESAVKLLLAGYSLQNITDIQVRPFVVRLEELLLVSPYRVALFDLMEKLVENYEETGKMYVSSSFINYSPTAKDTFNGQWRELEDFFFYYETPTLEMLKQDQSSSLPSGYISFSSTRALTACSLLTKDPNLKKLMWNEKKKLKSNEVVSFFENI